jgi:hypothetical protein
MKVPPLHSLFNRQTILDVCRKDVHPPGFYLLVSFWNSILTGASDSPNAGNWTLIDFNVEAIETMGLYKWQGPEGLIETPGVFPDQPIYWSETPLAPLWQLRLIGIFFGFLAMLFSYLLARILFPESLAIALLVLLIFTASGFTLTWDTVLRSYSCGAALCSGVALAGVWGLRADRLKTAGILVAFLIACAFLTNYPTLVVFPGLLLMFLLIGGMKRRVFAFVAISFIFAGILILALWGRSFFAQMTRVPSQALLQSSMMAMAGEQFERIVLDYWRLLFSEGIWRWMANRESGYLDHLVNLSPINPILYLFFFILYSASIIAAIYHA